MNQNKTVKRYKQRVNALENAKEKHQTLKQKRENKLEQMDVEFGSDEYIEAETDLTYNLGIQKAYERVEDLKKDVVNACLDILESNGHDKETIQTIRNTLQKPHLWVRYGDDLLETALKLDLRSVGGKTSYTNDRATKRMMEVV